MPNINMYFRIISFLILLLTTTVSYARTADLKDPAPIPIPQGLSSDQVQTATKGAVLQKGWAINRVITEEPRVEEVEYRIRSHSMTLTLEYLNDSIRLKYLQSENLNYKTTKKGPQIHPNYNVWAQQLADQIASNLSAGADFKLDDVTPKKAVNPPPKEAFSHFDQIEFETVKFDSNVGVTKVNRKTGENLEHNIKVAALAKAKKWNKTTTQRTLLVKPLIIGLKFVTGGERYFAGRMAGRSWISVKLTFIDKITGEVINEASLYRIAEGANGFTLARADYAMVENMGQDIVDYIDNNYETPVGGGATPP